MLGRPVRTLFDAQLEADTMHQLRIDGSGLPSGTYMIRFEGQTFITSQQVVLLK